MPAKKTIFILLGLLVAANISERVDSAPQEGDDENLVFEDDNLTFPADDDAAGSENIVFTDNLDDSTDENIQFEPLEVPETVGVHVALGRALLGLNVAHVGVVRDSFPGNEPHDRLGVDLDDAQDDLGRQEGEQDRACREDEIRLPAPAFGHRGEY